MLAYHNDPKIKANLLAQLAAHRAADEIVRGYGYWSGGRGCAVGCTIHSGDHAEYEPRYGIPQMIARLEDCIFEGLPLENARDWPARFSNAIVPGADLSLVGWKFLHWMLTDRSVNPGIDQPLVRDAVRQCADVIASFAKGGTADESAAASAAESAGSAASAAWSAAASAAESAGSAAWSAAASAAGSAAWSAAASAAWSAAESAAESAGSAAASAAESAASAAWSAAASAAWSAAGSAAYMLMADKLCELLAAA